MLIVEHRETPTESNPENVSNNTTQRNDIDDVVHHQDLCASTFVPSEKGIYAPIVIREQHSRARERHAFLDYATV